MDYKNTINIVMSASQTQQTVTIEASQTEGWLGPVKFKLASASSGTLSIQQIRNDVVYTVAAVTVTGKDNAIWSGSVHLIDGDTLVIHKDMAVIVNIMGTVTYESKGDGTWDEFVGAEVEESSSSSSNSSSSSSSSSEDYSDSSESSSSGGYSSESSESSELSSESSSSGV